MKISEYIAGIIAIFILLAMFVGTIYGLVFVYGPLVKNVEVQQEIAADAQKTNRIETNAMQSKLLRLQIEELELRIYTEDEGLV